MDMKDIQERITWIVRGMLEKGLRRPDVTALIYQDRATLLITHYDAEGDRQYINTSGASLEAEFDDAEAKIRALPSPEETAMRDALKLASRAVEALEKVGVGALGAAGEAFAAQLRKAMQDLSENALEDMRNDAG